MDSMIHFRKLWEEIYGENSIDLLETLLAEVLDCRKKCINDPHDPDWYRTAVVYSLYVDLFNVDFSGLSEKLDYLQDFGINCLWLLPVLDSPMRDAGFDIRDYRKIRPELLESTGRGQEYFANFLSEAHSRNLKVIFDIAINHTSDEHQWFQESRKSEANPFRDYYIWSKDTSLYKDARIIFEGLCSSNWEKDGEYHYFHRFFEFQPDLNYRNPMVLVEMCRNFLFWLGKGVDGFRADAIPYLWKKDGTTCENLPQTHTIVRFFRTLLDEVRPGTLLLAEACQKPVEVVKYFGNGDECNAGYHFPLMPQMFKSIASQSADPVRNVLRRKTTPAIPAGAQWFTFLRCHDELSLELVYVSEEDRKYIHDNYCKDPKWDFRLGQGVSARLAELMDRDPEKISLAYSVMLTLPGTPVIYYGDEFGKINDEGYYKEMISLTGKDDTRFLVRGKLDWDFIMGELKNPASFTSVIHKEIKGMVRTRNNYECFGKGKITWITVRMNSGSKNNSVMAFTRTYHKEKLLILHNLSDMEQPVYFESSDNLPKNDLFGKSILKCQTWEYFKLPARSWFWYQL